MHVRVKFLFSLLVFLRLISVRHIIDAINIRHKLYQDHRWHWMSYLCGLAINAYVYLYSIYYFLAKTRMSGLFQTVYYFAYTALFAILIGLLCGM